MQQKSQAELNANSAIMINLADQFQLIFQNGWRLSQDVVHIHISALQFQSIISKRQEPEPEK